MQKMDKKPATGNNSGGISDRWERRGGEKIKKILKKKGNPQKKEEKRRRYGTRE